MKRAMQALTALLVVCLMACGNTENEFTAGSCYFVFDNSAHQDATLAGAMNPNAPGIFCTITTEMRNGANYFNFSSSAGQNSSQIYNALDKRRTLALGFNDGIIVGFGALNQPPVFYAFDRECPNCFDPNVLPVRSKPLTMSSNGLATCNVCHRQYNMNSGGIVVAGDSGKKMTRYRASTTGPFGILAVN